MAGRGIRKRRRCRTHYEFLTSLDLLFTGILRASLAQESPSGAVSKAFWVVLSRDRANAKRSRIATARATTTNIKTQSFAFMGFSSSHSFRDPAVSGLFGLMDDHWISRRQPVS